MPSMTELNATAPSRRILVPARAPASTGEPKVRRYRLARMAPGANRDAQGAARFEHLRRSHD